MSTTVSPPSVEEVPPSKSFLERFVGVFASPGATFADIGRKPDFVAPLIAAIVSTMAMTETMLGKIGMERIVRMSIEQSGQASSLSPEQIEQRVSQGAKIGAIITHLAGLVGAPIFLLVIAGIGLLITNAIFGAQLNFKTAFSVACYANLVGVVGALMAMVMILLGDPERFNAQNPSPTNLGFFLNRLETSKPLLALASSIDILRLWLMGLLGIGFSEATGRKVKALSVFFSFLGLWAIWVAGRVGLAAIF